MLFPSCRSIMISKPTERFEELGGLKMALQLIVGLSFVTGYRNFSGTESLPLDIQENGLPGLLILPLATSFCGGISNYVCIKHFQRILEDFCNRITAEVHSLPRDMVRRAVMDMESRARLCIEGNGADINKVFDVLRHCTLCDELISINLGN